ncbi:hypothetical protein BDW59DRAFT_2529 [Aspergillus cavernicola]|uniref:Uncharacterized protein n=1 Tax=Aspergillus cavernicola TaxID=176166 RepID=A0ABR4J4S0_9EURO
MLILLCPRACLSMMLQCPHGRSSWEVPTFLTKGSFTIFLQQHKEANSLSVPWGLVTTLQLRSRTFGKVSCLQDITRGAVTTQCTLLSPRVFAVGLICRYTPGTYLCSWVLTFCLQQMIGPLHQESGLESMTPPSLGGGFSRLALNTGHLRLSGYCGVLFRWNYEMSLPPVERAPCSFLNYFCLLFNPECSSVSMVQKIYWVLQRTRLDSSGQEETVEHHLYPDISGYYSGILSRSQLDHG